MTGRYHPSKRQRPSVKKLRRRRKKLDAVLAKVKDGADLTQEKVNLYLDWQENKFKWQTGLLTVPSKSAKI